MNHALRVCVLQRLQHLHQRAHLLVEPQRPAPDGVGEARALQVLHHDEHEAVDFAGFEHRHDVGVLQAGAGLRLSIQALQVVGLVRVGAHRLERDDALEGGVEGLVDLAHPATAEQFIYPEASDAFGHSTKW